MEWQKTFGGSGFDEALGVGISKKQDYILVGRSSSVDNIYIMAARVIEFHLFQK